MPAPQPLSVAELCHHCDADCFDFADTSELSPLEEVIGQARAVEAVRFGIEIGRHGYHIFAHGPVGSGKSTTIRNFLENEAQQRATPHDWCYVFNFEQSYRPLALRFDPGEAERFRGVMNLLVDELLVVLPTLLETEANIERRQALLSTFEERARHNFEALGKRAKERGLALVQGKGGISIAPMKDGEVMDREAFMTLPENEQDALREEMEETQAELDATSRAERQIQREANEALAALDRQIAETEVRLRLDDLREQYAELPFVLRYFDSVQKDVLDHLELFERVEDEEEQSKQSAAHEGDEMAVARARRRNDARLRRYAVNVILDRSERNGAPVVVERYPTLANLVGRIEHEQRMGALVTDFTLIKPGALHRANGGFLVIEAEDLLQQPHSWDALKRALRHDEIRIEVPGGDQSPMTTVSIDPESIPLNCKVVLIGTTGLYFGLHEADSDVADLFKVGAEFAASMPRTPESEQLYARFIATVTGREQLMPFDREAVARIVEHSSRLTADSKRLSTFFLDITDLLREADYWAHRQGSDIVRRDDVVAALDARTHRADLSRDRMLESYAREIMLIDVEGERVGRVNGLTVLTRGDFSFGMPARISARVRMGAGKVLDIEREVALSGPFHSKGVLILSGYLGGRYVPDDELAIAASLTFEQSYNAVDGDSASSTELYALLSALAELPISQSFAVTGSVNQHGQVQAIGGVNEKIEGFYDVCRQRGFTGRQGVLIPASNVQHLMLRKDIVRAVADGSFSVYPITTIDEGIELLTGVEAGEADARGQFPPESVNGRVQARLRGFAERRYARFDMLS